MPSEMINIFRKVFFYPRNTVRFCPMSDDIIKTQKRINKLLQISSNFQFSIVYNDIGKKNTGQNQEKMYIINLKRISLSKKGGQLCKYIQDTDMDSRFIQ